MIMLEFDFGNLQKHIILLRRTDIQQKNQVLPPEGYLSSRNNGLCFVFSEAYFSPNLIFFFDQLNKCDWISWISWRDSNARSCLRGEAPRWCPIFGGVGSCVLARPPPPSNLTKQTLQMFEGNVLT